jgi:hypothetical protein
MELKPLKQWYCDSCGEVIEKAEEGWLEWICREDGEKWFSQNFNIVHHAAYSPRKPHDTCYQHTRSSKHIPGTLVMDDYLNRVVGDSGEYTLPFLLFLIDAGPFRETIYQGPKVCDLREWVELTRRLTLPYYEEARQYMSRADADGLFDGYPEPLIYDPKTLQSVLSKYSSRA